MSWMKVHSQLFSAPRALSISPHDRMMLLTVAYLRQETEIDGADDEEMAIALRIDPAECQRVKKVLVSKGLIDEEWNLKTDWVEPYETSAKRVKEWREKKKLGASEHDVTLHSGYSNATVTQCNALEKIREEEKREDNNNAHTRGPTSSVDDVSASLDSTAKGGSVTRMFLLSEGFSESEIERAIAQVEANGNRDKIGSYTNYVRGVCKKNRVNPPPWSEGDLPMVTLTEKDLANLRRGRGEVPEELPTVTMSKADRERILKMRGEL